jgi:hypothetical protein
MLSHDRSPLALTADKSRTHIIEPPAGFEDLAVTISEQRTVVIAYDGGTRGPADRRITPRATLPRPILVSKIFLSKGDQPCADSGGF